MLLHDLIYKITYFNNCMYASVEDETIVGYPKKWLLSVVETIKHEENISHNNFALIHKDSMGFWDGFNPLTGDILMLGSDNEKEAMVRYENMRKIK